MKNKVLLFNFFFLIIILLIPRGLMSQHFYFDVPPEWELIGEGLFKDYQQCFGYGDFDGDGINELIGSFSHSAVGIFIHRRTGDFWKAEILHPKFDTAFTHIKGMLGGWPVKGFISGDYDGDGRKEILSMADQVNYPPLHNNQTVPFPGCIYIDYVDGKGFIPNPLVWGKWGEELSSNEISVMVPMAVTPDFRSEPYSGKFMDFLVTTLYYNNDRLNGRLFVLEQPAKTFNSYDYRYITEDFIDTDTTYPNEPFYLNHLFLNSGGMDSELIFTPDEFPNAMSAYCYANIKDYDHDGRIDLFAAINYQNADSLTGGSIRVFKRLPSTPDHKYRFELSYRKDFEHVNFWGWFLANLDGDISNGKEGWIIGLRNDSAKGELGVGGLVTLQQKGDSWEVLGTFVPDRDEVEKEYRSIYDYAVVFDADNDGFDDALVNETKVLPVKIPYDTAHYIPVGDLILFRNLGNQQRTFKELFSFRINDYKVLWRSDCFTWDTHLEDFDDDGNLEVGCALFRREPAWEGLGAYGVYYSKVQWTDVEDESMCEGIKLTYHPNPFSELLITNYELLMPSRVKIEIFNSIGNKITTLVDEWQEAGNHQTEFKAEGLPQGMYYYTVQIGEKRESGKLIKL